MSAMHNPCHPGEVLKEALRQISVTDAAKRHGVGRGGSVNSDRVISGYLAGHDDRRRVFHETTTT